MSSNADRLGLKPRIGTRESEGTLISRDPD
jgi:hypothetical protein